MLPHFLSHLGSHRLECLGLDSRTGPADALIFSPLGVERGAGERVGGVAGWPTLPPVDTRPGAGERPARLCLKATSLAEHVDCPETAFSQGLAVLIIPSPAGAKTLDSKMKSGEGLWKGRGEGKKLISRTRSSICCCCPHSLSVTPPAPRSPLFIKTVE